MPARNDEAKLGGGEVPVRSAQLAGAHTPPPPYEHKHLCLRTHASMAAHL